MRKVLIGSLGLLSSVALADDAGWRDAFIAQIGENEPKVVEAMFTSPDILWLSVVDDGSSRDRYARYFCLILPDEAPATRVRIWDAGAMAREELLPLGEAWCD